MGILDNIDQFFLAQTTMGKNAREDQLAQEGRLRQQQQQAQIEALLNTAGQAPATSSMERAQMLTGGGQLPQAPGIDPVTMARIGNVMQNPAVMGAAGQMASSEFNNRNMSAADTARIEQMRLQRESEQADRQRAYNWEVSRLNPANQPKPPSLADMKAMADMKMGLNTEDEDYATALDVADFVKRAPFTKNLTTPSNLAAVQAAWASTALPYLAKKFGAKSMQEAEQELFTQLAGDPTSINLSDKTQRVVDYWVEDMGRRRKAQYAGYQLSAPEIKVGQSGLSQVLRRNAPQPPDPSRLVAVPGGQAAPGNDRNAPRGWMAGGY